MFEYISGILEEIRDEHVVVDVHGIGYAMDASLSTTAALPAPGEHVKIFTYFHVREDIQKLFGFASVAERETFLQLLAISGVGPKVALCVLSGLPLRDLAFAVETGDTARFKSISGVGPKTAQRIVLELKGKLDPKLLLGAPVKMTKKAAPSAPRVYTAREDAYAALTALGYNDVQIMNALSRVEETVGDADSVEVWIKTALKVI